MLSEETDGTGETDQLGFAISDSPVNKSAVYKMEENTLQEICNFLGRIKNNIKLARNSILDPNWRFSVCSPFKYKEQLCVRNISRIGEE